MNSADIARKSTLLVTEFAKNNTEPLFQALADDILLIGPINGMVFHSKAELAQYYETRPPFLPYLITNIATDCKQLSVDSCDVLMKCNLTILFPNRLSATYHQMIRFSWSMKDIPLEDGQIRREPRVSIIHLSIAVGNKNDDSTPIQFYESLSHEEVDYRRYFDRVYFHGMKKECHFYFVDAISCIETAAEGRHCTVYCADAKIDCFERLKYFEENYPDYFLRVHNSFLVNPLFVQSISRYKAVLTNGRIIPIPKSKYMTVKGLMENWNPGPRRILPSNKESHITSIPV